MNDGFTSSEYDVSVTKKCNLCHRERVVDRFPLINFNSMHNDVIQFMRRVHKARTADGTDVVIA